MDSVMLEIEQYKKELDNPRQRVSESCQDIIRYATSESDPLRDGVPDENNRYKSPKGCIIL